jgi:cytochrome P450
MDSRVPVQDWFIDFDHFDSRWTENPYPIWDELRQKCPVATSQRFQDGAYFPTRFDDVREIAYDAEHFSSRRVIVREHKLPLIPGPPITSDPPEHTPARKLLLPAFAPKEIAKLEERTRAICRSLLDAIGDSPTCDGAVDYAQHIPVRVIAHMLGVSEDNGDLFRDWIYRSLIEGVRNPAAAISAMHEQSAFFKEQVDLRRKQPGDDLVSFLVRAEFDGKPLSEPHILGTLRLLLIAGIDTTWSGIGAAIWHLATHPEDRARLLADPGLLPTAIEEFLRAYSPVTMAREVVQETTLGGCPFKPGGQVLLSFPAANRDPAKFADADKVLIDRAENPHAAFGLGRHRCLGSNLARMEMTVAVEEWLKRFPDFTEMPGRKTTWSEGTVRGPRTLPITINR